MSTEFEDARQKIRDIIITQTNCFASLNGYNNNQCESILSEKGKKISEILRSGIFEHQTSAISKVLSYILDEDITIKNGDVLKDLVYNSWVAVKISTPQDKKNSELLVGDVVLVLHTGNPIYGIKASNSQDEKCYVLPTKFGYICPASREEIEVFVQEADLSYLCNVFGIELNEKPKLKKKKTPNRIVNMPFVFNEYNDAYGIMGNYGEVAPTATEQIHTTWGNMGYAEHQTQLDR